MKLTSYIALAALATTTAANAEGIALGNPFVGSSFAGLFGLPLFGSVLLLLVMAFMKGLRKSLFVSLLLCAFLVGSLTLIGTGGMSNETIVFWLAGLALSPWICFVIIIVCFIVALRTRCVKDKRASMMPNLSIESGPPAADAHFKRSASQAAASCRRMFL